MKRVGYRFSRFEIRELSKAWIVLSLAFAVLFNPGNYLSTAMVVSFIVSGLTVGIAFLLHELGHKFVAQRYGLWAEFRAHNEGLMLALVMSFFGFIFAAPGAVMIHGHTSLNRIGKISAAGPLVNYVLSMLFMGFAIVNPVTLIQPLFSYGASINAFLGLFNMIPFGMFDGKKILAWSKVNYGLMVVVGFVLVFLTFL